MGPKGFGPQPAETASRAFSERQRASAGRGCGPRDSRESQNIKKTGARKKLRTPQQSEYQPYFFEYWLRPVGLLLREAVPVDCEREVPRELDEFDVEEFERPEVEFELFAVVDLLEPLCERPVVLVLDSFITQKILLNIVIVSLPHNADV